MAQLEEIVTTGRRKTAIASVRLSQGGEGNIQINGKSFEDYFPTTTLQNLVLRPLETTELLKSVNIRVKTTGGGPMGQAGAISLGIARALLVIDEEFRVALRAGGLLTRDPRMRERKKAGQPGARKRFQFSKR